ncbi:enoyl-[acyl-carrier-protein] reductase FabK [Anaerotruncus colihominis]|uniref:Probable nitronate monooxygenase n=1 Tax=Anaerotruncus colihominis TaxID=169435 RepID=A0A3E3IIZ0_9FIRM|nr:enoyl-[acyl-carrier-protein] reductase FabK [Anaerotruncus colihominis]MCQ4734422.1 enoyl-[acyl-carrier-protein] reductase FabK [Anaerotruncus colihominis]OUO66373.1 nitronate monooxygenase [Anaerotruncus colihominis]RGE67059.1 enoyl-[acyl-carrier-protein] reductase FabK [Anaerotruncus colihominis]UOX67293.1 enoyl-[acyl-carrier-protein] reductase FabK [Anaerotruncus colihominis]UWN76806.1 enoyl-[acyl-carrier-protein] reductase FabK [Anaerotruncus colihominis]
MKTKITEMLGIRHPLFQGGMAWVADAKLAAAVSNAGGLGLIGAAAAPGDVVQAMIREAKSLTDKPFGVNVMLLSPFADDVARICAEEKVAVVTTGAGNPGKYMDMWKGVDIKVIPVVASAALAKRMERAGADAVIAEGCESGGHIGELTTMALVPQVADAVSVPVIAAGGIADGRGVAAAFALGAQAVQCGTVFVCAEESPACDVYRRQIIDAKDTDTIVTGREGGAPIRSIKTKFTRRLLKMENQNVDRVEFEKAAAGSLRKAVQDGNLDEGTFMAGQISGLVKAVEPAQAIVDRLMREGEELMKNLFSERGITIE